MLARFDYNRSSAVAYSNEWALKRNPRFLDFENLGGDCSNFCSQCIYAGAGVMNYTPTMGWYYNSAYDRAPAWTAVLYLYNFLVRNKGVGPYASIVELGGIMPGDIIQLDTGLGYFHHSVVVIQAGGMADTLVNAHTYDALQRPLNTYNIEQVRYLHIEGVRKYV